MDSATRLSSCVHMICETLSRGSRDFNKSSSDGVRVARAFEGTEVESSLLCLGHGSVFVGGLWGGTGNRGDAQRKTAEMHRVWMHSVIIMATLD